jgi:tetratricopeptide (TPR) repeat protein
MAFRPTGLWFRGDGVLAMTGKMAELGEFNVVLRRALMLAGNDPLEAVRVLEEGLRAARERGAAPAIAALAKNAALVCYTVGSLELSARYYEEAQASSPSDATLWLVSGEVRLAMGQKDAAKQDYAHALVLARQSGDSEMAALADVAAGKVDGHEGSHGPE